MTTLTKRLEYKCKNIQWLQLWQCIKVEISRFWVQVQSKMAMKSEWKNIMLQSSLQNWWLVVREVREVNVDLSFVFFFFCYFLSSIHTVLWGYVCNIVLRSFFQYERRRGPSWYAAFIHSAELIDRYWQLNTHAHSLNTPNHNCTTLSVWESLHKDTGGHLNQRKECVCVYDKSAWFVCLKATSHLSGPASKR